MTSLISSEEYKKLFLYTCYCSICDRQVHLSTSVNVVKWYKQHLIETVDPNRGSYSAHKRAIKTLWHYNGKQRELSIDEIDDFMFYVEMTDNDKQK